MINSLINQMGMADKLSVAQLQTAIKNGTLQPYIGIPLLQTKVKQEQQAKMAMQGQQPQQPSIAQQVMQQAQQASGVDQLHSGLPPEGMAGGGIVSFAGAGKVEEKEDPYAKLIESQSESPIMDYLRGILGGKLNEIPASRRGVYGAYEPPTPTQSVPPTPTPTPQPGIAQLPGATAVPAPVPIGTQPGIAPLGTGSGFATSAKPEVSTMATAQKMLDDYNKRASSRDEAFTKAIGDNKMTGGAFDDMKKTLEQEALAAGAEKDQAKGMAIFKAGLAMMAGGSQNALQNIGAGAMVGASDYEAANKDLKKAALERRNHLGYIEQARRAETRDDMKTRNEALRHANDAAEKRDAFGVSAIMKAGEGDRDRAVDMWKTTQLAGATVESARLGQEGKIEAALIRGATAGRGVESKGAMTDLQIGQEMQKLEQHPEYLKYKKDLLGSKGANTINDPNVQKLLRKKLDDMFTAYFPRGTVAHSSQQAAPALQQGVPPPPDVLKALSKYQ